MFATRKRSRFGERAAAFDVILAGEAGGDGFIGACLIAVGRIFDVFVDYRFGGDDRQRRVIGDGVGVLLHKGFEHADLQHVINEANAVRFPRRIAACGEHDFLGDRGANQIHQLRQ